MQYLKLIPLAIAVAMLSTLTYMTFVPAHYLSLQIPQASFIKFKNDAAIFDDYAKSLKAHKVTTLLSLLKADEDSAHLSLVQRQTLLANELSSRLERVDQQNTIHLNLHVKKNTRWKREYLSAMKASIELIDTGSPLDLSVSVTWETDYLKLLRFFCTVFFVALACTIPIQRLKLEEEPSA